MASVASPQHMDTQDLLAPWSPPGSPAQDRRPRKPLCGLRVSVVCSVAVAVAVAVALTAGILLRKADADVAVSGAAYGANGVVSTEHELATEAGLNMLKAGGNAIDAAAVVQFVLNVVQPQRHVPAPGTVCHY